VCVVCECFVILNPYIYLAVGAAPHREGVAALSKRLDSAVSKTLPSVQTRGQHSPRTTCVVFLNHSCSCVITITASLKTDMIDATTLLRLRLIVLCVRVYICVCSRSRVLCSCLLALENCGDD